MLVLTYHSISDAAGPTSIPPAVFAQQMQVLADLGRRGVTLDEFIAWHEGDDRNSGNVLITFDDAFDDFAQVAAPILRRHGFSALMFVPTRRLGHPEAWQGANNPARPLMDWATVRALAKDGMEFGGHSRTHADLTKLAPADREEEIAGCADDLSAEIGKPVEGFAAPYGRVSPEVVETIGKHYRAAFGVRLDVPKRADSRFDLPRIDMHYFRDRKHWTGLLEGRRTYLRARQALRAVRSKAVSSFY
ncbi:polysaccharide deacetylase family protein [Sphingomonas daechungensis]|uniref:polysaccharide deacetylase family protein n=1 Tax=Sphingomonas daechungensis TaxID=1176646 RepID=UPI0037852E68